MHLSNYGIRWNTGCTVAVQTNRFICDLVKKKKNSFSIMSLVRKATLSRKTNETDINVELCLDSAGNQEIDINSGIGFLNHVIKLTNFMTR